MLAIIIIMKFIKSNIKSNHYENMQYDYKFIMNKEYLLSILIWMPFLHVKFMRAKIKFINFPSLNCSCFDSYFSELCYWPKSETYTPLTRSPPPNPSPVDIPPIHSLISVLIVNILSVPPVLPSPPAQSFWAVKSTNLCMPFPLLKNFILFHGVKSQIPNRIYAVFYNSVVHLYHFNISSLLIFTPTSTLTLFWLP